MTKSNDWVKVGQRLAQNLEGVIDEAKIKELVINTVNQITESGLNLKRPLAVIRKEIEAKFPTVLATEDKPDSYYFTNSGKGRVERFEHLSLWYLTQNTDRWEVTGDDARKKYWESIQKFPQKETIEKPIEKPKTKQFTLTTEMLENSIIESLELDKETLDLLHYALEKSEKTLAEFLKDSIRINAKATAGRYKRTDEENLEEIPTSELINNSKYATYPGRAEEMVKRAINAIKIYNSEVATEPKQRWIITQSLLTELTGSRGSVVQIAMQKYAKDINDHHQKYPEFFNDDGTLKQYHNRKRGVEIREEIKLEKLVPNG